MINESEKEKNAQSLSLLSILTSAFRRIGSSAACQQQNLTADKGKTCNNAQKLSEKVKLVTNKRPEDAFR